MKPSSAPHHSPHSKTKSGKAEERPKSSGSRVVAFLFVIAVTFGMMFFYHSNLSIKAIAYAAQVMEVKNAGVEEMDLRSESSHRVAIADLPDRVDLVSVAGRANPPAPVVLKGELLAPAEDLVIEDSNNQLPEFAYALSEEAYLQNLMGEKPKKKVMALASPPLALLDLLPYLKPQEGTADSGISEALARLQLNFQNRDSAGLSQWVENAHSSPRGVNFEIGNEFTNMEDHVVAFKWYQKAVIETTSAEAFFQVGAAQMFGRGTVTNYTKAHSNLFHSLRGENGDAAYVLGVAYLSGVGTAQNPTHAYRLFQQGIANGSRFGYGESARMREVGDGVSKDLVRAIDLYVQGAQVGDPFCIKRLIDLSTADEKGEWILNPTFAIHWKKILPGIQEHWISSEARRLLPVDFLEG